MTSFSDITQLRSVLGDGASQEQEFSIDHLDYAYIKQCSSEKELHRLQQVLQSGSEGYWPLLEQAVQERLSQLSGIPTTSDKAASASEATSLLKEWVQELKLSESRVKQGNLKEREADLQRIKGNDCFKSSEYAEAISYYSKSISINETAAALNNRSLAFLKTKENQKAEADATRVLQIATETQSEFKALLRRAQARFNLTRYDLAFEDLTKAKTIDSTSKELSRLFTLVNSKLSTRRLVVEDAPAPVQEQVPAQVTSPLLVGQELEIEFQ